MAEAKAIARYVRVSPQKARLVVDLIRGKRAEDALHLLEFTQKAIAPDVLKLLRSAIANATDRGEVDVDRLFVTRAWVNEGPRQKRIRPAPMGRAYRYQRRSAHIEVHVGERLGAAVAASTVEAEPAPPPTAPRRRAPLKRAAKPGAKKAGAKPAKAGKAGAKPAARPSKSKSAARKPAKGKRGE